MQFPYKLLPYLAILLLGVALFFSIKSCNQNAERLQEEKQRHNDSVGEVEMASFYNRLQHPVQEITVVKTLDEASLRTLAAAIFQLKAADEAKIKKVDGLAVVTQQVATDTIHIPLIPSWTADNGTVSAFNDSTLNYFFKGTVTKDTLSINKLQLNDTLSFRLVEKRGGFLKPRITSLQAIHSNPFYTTTKIQTLALRTHQSRWNQYIKPALALVAGYYIKTRL